jgi:D-hydroxyproline dehydrogenase subunit beta
MMFELNFEITNNSWFTQRIFEDEISLHYLKMDRKVDVAIVGGGIIGLAHAYIALRQGLRVALFERDELAQGASVRNFGLIWPIGQAPGVGLEIANRSRELWVELSQRAGFWLHDNGSLHLAYHEDEWEVLQQFHAVHKNDYPCMLIEPDQVQRISPLVKSEGLLGALWSKIECTINSREVVQRLPLWLMEKHGLIARFGHPVLSVEPGKLKTSSEKWEAEKIIICNGYDFSTLYPVVFSSEGFTKCKLQMMKMRLPDSDFKLGPSLCAGLTLRHYAAFSKCPSLPQVDARYDKTNSLFKKYGIHVLVSQNNSGDLIVGDSHQYGLTPSPFDEELINELILSYLKSFFNTDNLLVTERWHGIYPKVEGKIFFRKEVEPTVIVVNALGGAGMTLSLGLAEETIGQLLAI